MRTATNVAWETEEDLQLALNVLLSCWARMRSDEREMSMRLIDRYEFRHGVVDRDWLAELKGDEE